MILNLEKPKGTRVDIPEGLNVKIMDVNNDGIDFTLEHNYTKRTIKKYIRNNDGLFDLKIKDVYVFRKLQEHIQWIIKTLSLENAECYLKENKEINNGIKSVNKIEITTKTIKLNVKDKSSKHYGRSFSENIWDVIKNKDMIELFGLTNVMTSSYEELQDMRYRLERIEKIDLILK